MKPTIIHVLSSARRRGAEVYAAELAREIASRVGEQRFLILRNSEKVEIDFHDGCEVIIAHRAVHEVLQGVSELRSLMQSDRPSFVVGHGYVPTRTAVLAAFGLRHPPIIIQQKIGFTSDWLGWGRLVRVALARLVISKVAASIAIGEGQATELVELLGADPARVHLLANGRRLPNFDASITRREDLILVVGSLSEEKRPPVALHLIESLAAKGVDVRLRFVGDGPLRDEIRADIIRRGLADRVELTGSVLDVWSHYREATLLLICSATEGTPGVAIEAALAGLPVVCWDVGDVSSVVADGASGIIVPFGDLAALTDAVKILLMDPKMRMEMGQNASRRGGDFDLRKVANDFLSILKGINGMSSSVDQ